MKRIVAVLLSLVLLFCLAPVSALADDISAPAIPLGDGYVEIENPQEDAYVCFTPEETGTYVFTSRTEDVDVFCELYNSKMEELAGDDDGGENINFRLFCELTGGELYYFAIRCYSDGYTGQIPVRLEKTDYTLKSLKVISEPDVKSVIRGVTDLPELTGLKLEVTWSDGQVDIWDGAQNGSVRGERVQRSMNFGGESDTTAYLLLSLGGKTVSLEYPIIADPVEKIELLAAPAFRLIYELDGYTDRKYTFDGYEDYFRYYYSYQPGGFRIRITMKDGSFEDRILNDTLFGYSIWLEDPQYQEHWTLGDNNRLYVRFMAHKTEVPVSVIEDPVAGFELVEPAVIELIEHADGFADEYYNSDIDETKEYFRYNLDSVYYSLKFRINYKDGTSKIAEYGEITDGGHIYDCTDQASAPWTMGEDNRATFAFRDFMITVPVRILENPIDRIEVTANPTKVYTIGDPEFGYTSNDVYFLYPMDLTGIAFTVYYKDGTSKNVTYKDFNQEYWGDNLLDGYFVWVNSLTNPKPGDNAATLTYMGIEAPLTLSVKESSVQEVKLIKEPDKTEYYPGYFPDLRGAQFEITFKDGSQKTVAVTDGSYDYFEYQLILPVEEELNLYVNLEYDMTQQMHYVAVCMDQSCVLDCLTEVQGKRPVRVVPQKADAQEYDTAFTLYFADGTSEEVVVAPFKRHDAANGAHTFTNGGVIYLDVSKEETVWILTVQNMETNILFEVKDFLKGDVDGNGVVNSTDARLVLQLSVNKITKEDLKVPEAADVDGSGDNTSTDARLILQYAVNKITAWP